MRQNVVGLARPRANSLSRQPCQFRFAVRDHVHQNGADETAEQILCKVGKLHLELLTPDLPGVVRVAIQSDQPRCLSLKLLDEDPRVFLRKEMALQDGEGRRLDGFLANGNRVRAGATFLLAVIDNMRAVFGRSYAAEPDQLMEQLRADEVISEADTLLLTVPNQLGVDYNAHVLESVLTHVVPRLAGVEVARVMALRLVARLTVNVRGRFERPR